MSLIPIVDEYDNILYYKERSLIDMSERYRVSALWITNSKGEVLVAERHRKKKHHPLRWGPAVAGTVEQDETYRENIEREMLEELGIRGAEIDLGPKIKTITGHLHFTQLFTLTLDVPLEYFQIQADEVEALRWITLQNLQKELATSPDNFTPSMQNILSIFS